MVRCYFIILMCSVFLNTMKCSVSTISGNGGSSETVNVKVILKDTTVVAIFEDQTRRGLSLNIYSSAYQPYEKFGFCDSATDSSSNSLQWNAPIQGTFCFILRTIPFGKSCFVRDIQLKSDLVDTIDCVLGQLYELRGTIESESAKTITEEYILSINGSPYYGVTDFQHSFSIHEVPSGLYTLSLRPLRKRLFIRTNDYSINTDSLVVSENIRILLP